MTTRSTLRPIVTLCLFIFIASVAAASRPVSGQTCDTVTDVKIVADIYAKIKANKALAAQIPHINVVSVFAAVKLQGWADNKRDFDKIVGFAKTTACVKLVNVNLFEPAPPPSTNRLAAGCSAGTKPCGDICIPEGDSCNIAGALESRQSFPGGLVLDDYIATGQGIANGSASLLAVFERTCIWEDRTLGVFQNFFRSEFR